jgi:predicted O-methyltransferase YrrM
MTTLEKRIDLIKLLPPKARMAEVGSWRGYFAVEILNHTDVGHLVLVDSWENLDAEHNESALVECRHHLRGHVQGGRFSIIRKRSLDAVKDFKDGELDAAYIDADHTYQAALDDLHAWSRVVRTDGWLMGHDHVLQKDNPMAKRLNFGVVEAVEQFCKETEWKMTYITAEDFASFGLQRK